MPTGTHREWRLSRPGLKRFLPASLFGRALLIQVVPLVLLQLLVVQTFYQRHWDSVVRNMASSAAADIAMLADQYRDLAPRLGQKEALKQTVERGRMVAVDVRYIDDASLRLDRSRGREKYPDFYEQLRNHIDAPFTIAGVDEDNVRVRVNTDRGVLDFTFARKRLASSTTGIFILWMVGSALLLTVIAVLFLRNQIRPIVQLARAAEQFGLGQEMVDYVPRGAMEVRQAGRAFLVMAERVRRAVTNRTEMLAGISHDLRTPLTRMTLELEMAGLDQATRQALQGDIDEMRKMIDEYLDFSRGDAGEPTEPTDLAALVTEVVGSYRRQKQKVTVGQLMPVTLGLRPQAIRRVLTNLIDNALRYGGGQAAVHLEASPAYARVKVTDQGPGIPISAIDTVFKPFTRLEPSRNAATGGTGLGLAIARSIAQDHGGDITLENCYNHVGEVTGLEATLRLPREVQPQ
jgi:two-component system osmolarity sensor histidine kinase EnvZ